MRTPLWIPATLVAGIGCAETRPAEDWTTWYAEGTDYDVQEALEWTTEPYGDLTSEGTVDIGTGGGSVFPVDDWFSVVYGPDEGGWESAGACDSLTDDDLPFTFTGVISLNPSLYYKTDGCVADGFEDSDEKYYSSYMIEDDTGAFFVLYDSRIARFGPGDTVTLKVRAVRTSYDLNLIYAHDIVAVENTNRPLHYELVESGPLTTDMVPRVHRVTGDIVGYDDWVETCGSEYEPGNAEQFGEFLLQADDGTCHSFSLGLELGRRGATWEAGTRMSVTGPVLDSFGVKIVVETLGQIEVLN